MKLIRFLLFASSCLLMASCVTQSQLYDWRNYEKTSYSYTKEPSEKHEEELIKTYTKMIEKPNGARKVVPPGVCAELGYVYFKKGEKDKAIYYLEKEIEVYPESAVFIKRIIDAVKQ